MWEHTVDYVPIFQELLESDNTGVNLTTEVIVIRESRFDVVPGDRTLGMVGPRPGWAGWKGKKDTWRPQRRKGYRGFPHRAPPTEAVGCWSKSGMHGIRGLSRCSVPLWNGR